ncbi:hypothetical protein ACGP04_15375 [Piscirickettsia salmonis]
MLGDFASLDVQNTYRGSDAYGCFRLTKFIARIFWMHTGFTI